MNVKEIQEQFNQVIAYSQGIDVLNTDNLFKQWFEAKRDFIEAFGGKLIYELALPVTFELTQDARAERINNLIDYVEDKYDNPALRSFINRNRDTFFDNKVFRYESVAVIIDILLPAIVCKLLPIPGFLQI